MQAAKGLHLAHPAAQSFRLGGGTVAGGLENEPTVDHPGNAAKALILPIFDLSLLVDLSHL
jgi:hypothetical protein